MGLFDRFKKKKETNSAQESATKEPKKKQIEENSGTPDPSIDPIPELLKISYTEEGGHGDNFGGLIGFEYLNTEEGNNFLNEQIAASTTIEPIATEDGIAFHDLHFNDTILGLRTLVSHGNMFSCYPYLKPSFNLPFETTEVIEWSHINGFEGEIKGRGRDTFGLGFFATDYALKKETYQSEKEITIRLSAIALVMDEFKSDKIGDQPISDDFAAYMPNTQIPNPTYYDYIGIINEVKPLQLGEDVRGYLCNIKLINQPEDPDFFTVDLFINQENMRIDSVETGMRVTGALWFQGELAE